MSDPKKKGKKTKKKSGEVKISRFFVEEQPKAKWYAWTDDDGNALPDQEVDDILGAGVGAVLGELDRRMAAADIRVDTAYGIRHGSDLYQLWSEARGTYVDRDKEEHDHMAFSLAKPATVSKIAEATGIDPAFIRPLKKGGSPVTTRAAGRVPYGWDAMLGYFTHTTDPLQHQYSPDEVVTLRGPAYAAIHAERYRAWRETGARKAMTQTNRSLPYLADLARAGEVTKAQIMATDWMWNIYSRNSESSDRPVDHAFALYGERQSYLAAAALKRGEFRTTTIYVHGDNGTGKSYAAEEFCDELVELSRRVTGVAWRVYNPAAKHVFDTYAGQEIVFLDEARVDSMAPGEWLMFLDPDRASQQGARYRNKERIAPRVIVITNTTPPLEFFFYAQKKGDVDEAMGQFIRRLTRVVEVHRDNPETPDETWRYGVSSVEHVEAYDHRLMTRRGVASFKLNRAFVDDGEYTRDGLYAVLAATVDDRCHDLDMSAADGWNDAQTTAQAELTAYRDHVAGTTEKELATAELADLDRRLGELDDRVRDLDADLVNVREAADDFGDREFTLGAMNKARRDQLEERAGIKAWRRELNATRSGLCNRLGVPNTVATSAPAPASFTPQPAAPVPGGVITRGGGPGHATPPPSSAPVTPTGPSKPLHTVEYP